MVRGFDPLEVAGRVIRVVGLTVEASGLELPVGELCRVGTGETAVVAEVVGFREETTLLLPLGELGGIAPGQKVVPTGRAHLIGVGWNLLGRVLDGLGQPLDGRPLPPPQAWYPVQGTVPNPLSRRRITQALPTGVRAVDAVLTLGRGQRMGIFAGSGVGKSTLLGMIARHSRADVNVIALIGERGREVLDFLERDLGPQGRERSVVVVATSDRPALVRVKGALVATAIAEFFRDQGAQVMLMMDSLTRLAMAQREVGLAVGEPPTARGYTPSVFALLPQLLERAGQTEKGSITGLYTVLVDGDDFNEPISDAARAILDGHIVLSRRLANRNHFPAIEVTASVSRLMGEVASPEHREAAGRLRELLAAYEQVEDLINIGAYQKGSNARVDRAVEKHEAIMSFLRQGLEEYSSFEEALAGLETLVA
ncbi:MAG: flagellar protein export ATPase FliI [Clostridia bacterium]|jgi:flagellum-specific ATP synthase/type III secretion protein N (ATPase)|nr:flagellar protein export ATPase FliI [Clostridia bacterium]MDH7573454.1 flagellar protein export ATPase FliI [Clostridia bacterium]